VAYLAWIEDNLLLQAYALSSWWLTLFLEPSAAADPADDSLGIGSGGMHDRSARFRDPSDGWDSCDS
jgi:hypothetical protein